MPRNLSPSVLAQTLSNQLQPALFVEIEFLTETIWVWSGLGSITAPGPAYDTSSSFPYGQPFTGIGWLGQIRAVPQVTDIVASNITLELSGIPSELLTDAINAVRQNSVATVWLGFLSLQPGNPEVIGDPVQIFQGALDVPTITEGAETSSIAITCENPLIDLNRAPSRRFTDVDQQVDYPGDTGFAQVQLLQDYDIVWPAASGSSTTTPAPPNFIQIYVGAVGDSGPFPIAVGETLQLQCQLTRSDGSTGDISSFAGDWISNDDTVATVDGNSGIVTAVGPGFCNVIKRFVQGLFTTTHQSSVVQAAVTIIVTGPGVSGGSGGSGGGGGTGGGSGPGTGGGGTGGSGGTGGGGETVDEYWWSDSLGSAADGSNVDFTLTYAPTPPNMLILTVDGQTMTDVADGGTDFTLSGTDIAFATPPRAGANIRAWYLYTPTTS